MKKNLLCLAVGIFTMMCLCTTVNAQTILRCNNIPGVTGVNVYTTLQAAHDAAVAGDIIYVEPSQFAYGGINVRKRLTIIGTGYHLAKNSNVPFDNRVSDIGGVTFENGSANSVLSGVYVRGFVYVNDVSITITRCKTSNIYFGSSYNAVTETYTRGNSVSINKCFVFGSIISTNSASAPGYFGNNCAFTNNIVYSGIYSMANSVISNNTFNSSSPLNELYGCSVSNNILDVRSTTGTIKFVTSGTGNTISNNICLGPAATPTGNGNVSSANATITFLTVNPWATSSTEDSPFQLASGSPAAGIGTGGTDAGAFGGGSPYVLSGLPEYPVITNFLVSGAGNSTVPLNVSVTVRGNN